MTYENVGILEDLSRRYNEYSPDYLERKLEGEIPVFVYGSLREGFHNHSLLDGSAFLGRGITSIEKFEMREPHHGGFPLVFENGARTSNTNASSGKIQGEVYVVNPLTLLALDQLESNGRMYTRSRQWITLKDQNVGKASFKPTIQAWMYISQKPFWRERATKGVKSVISNKTRQYDWSDVAEPKQTFLI